MKLSQMECFLAVAEYLNFTLAAKSLYISQPALSKQIAMLEEEIGTKLFIRNSKKVAITAAGEQLKKDFLEISIQLEQATQRARAIGEQEKPIVRIGCFDGLLTSDFLPNFYEYIHSLDSRLQIFLNRGDFVSIKKALDQDSIDILVTLDLDWEKTDAYHWCELQKRKGALIYSVNSPLANKTDLRTQDFEKEYFLVPAKSKCFHIFDRAMENLKKIGIYNPKILEVENMATLSAYLEIGKGYAFLGDSIVEHNTLYRKMDVDIDGLSVLAIWKKDNMMADILMDEWDEQE